MCACAAWREQKKGVNLIKTTSYPTQRGVYAKRAAHRDVRIGFSSLRAAACYLAVIGSSSARSVRMWFAPFVAATTPTHTCVTSTRSGILRQQKPLCWWPVGFAVPPTNSQRCPKRACNCVFAYALVLLIPFAPHRTSRRCALYCGDQILFSNYRTVAQTLTMSLFITHL